MLNLGMSINRIKEFRKELKLSQEGLASQLGYSVETVRKHEQGSVSEPILGFARACAKVFNRQIDEIFLQNSSNKSLNSALEPEAQADLATAKLEHQILTDMYLEDAPKTMSEALRIARETRSV